MTLRVAIVGCGKIADTHVAEIQKLDGAARVVAVVDREILMAEQLAVRFGVPCFMDDLDQMLDRARPEVVHVATPPGSHLAIARRCLEAGAHVFVEKPLTPTYEETRELVALAFCARKKLTTGHGYAFDPPALALAELLRRGDLGDPVHLESFYGYDLENPFGTALLGDRSHWVHDLPGKLFQNNVDHLLAKIVGLLGEEGADPLAGLRIDATGFRRRTRLFGDARDDLLDELRVGIVGPKLSANAVFTSHVQPVQHFAKIYGTLGTAQVDYEKRTVTLEARPRVPSALGRLSPAFDQGLAFLREGMRNVASFARADFHYFAGLSRLLRLFYESIETDGPPPIPYRDLLRGAALADEIFRQVPQGKPKIHLAPRPEARPKHDRNEGRPHPQELFV